MDIKMEIRKHALIESIVNIGDIITNDFLNKWCPTDYEYVEHDNHHIIVGLKTVVPNWVLGECNCSWEWDEVVVESIIGDYVIIQEDDSYGLSNRICLDKREVEYGYKQEGYGKKGHGF